MSATVQLFLTNGSENYGLQNSTFSIGKLFLFLFVAGIIISAIIKSFEEKPTVAIKNKAYV